MEHPARKVLELVHELHLRGYERLRVSPGMSPSGLHWRCYVAPVQIFSGEHGARIADRRSPLIAHYTSPSGNQYFGWEDAGTWDAAQLAGAFMERFPAISKAGYGSDPAYARWYAEMLRLTEPDSFPIAFADGSLPPDYLTTVGRQRIKIPLPPPADPQC